MRGRQDSSRLVIKRSLNLIFVFIELCLLPHALGSRIPLERAPEGGFPLRRLGVTDTSTPGLGANAQPPPLTGAAQTCAFLHFPSTGATGHLPVTFKVPPRVPERRHSEKSAPLSDLAFALEVPFGTSLP